MNSKEPTDTETTVGPSRFQRIRWVALVFLTLINLLNYIDRYIYSALMPAIKNALHFSDTELGVLGTAFLLAYIGVTPLLGFFGDRGNRSRIMSVGVGIWSISTAFSGICTSFFGQLFTRAAVGLGESAYVVASPSTLADFFPKRLRGRVFAVYSGAIPVGSALGYVIGGWLEPRFGWQKAFFVVGVPGLVLALLLFFLPDPPRGHAEEAGDSRPETAKSSTKTETVAIYRALLRNGGFFYTSLGYAAYTFVLGGMAFWMPSYLVRYFDVSLEKANMEFGALTVAGGFLGTVLGGVWADRIEKRSGNGYLKVSIWSMLLSAPLFWIALEFKDFHEFLVALFFLEIALFLPISPLDAALVSYVKPAWRATSTGLNILIIHLLGDGISRTLIGVVSDHGSLHLAMGLLPWFLFLAAGLWVIGLLGYFQPVRWPAQALRLPLWQAHRGCHVAIESAGFSVPSPPVENTLAAFRKAKELGALMVECDVRLSRDQQVVVCHDEDLRRLAGRQSRVANLTAGELRQHAQIPLLSELLEDPKCPSMVNIELKTDEGWPGQSGLEKRVAEAVARAKAQGRVLISSFNPLALRRIAQAAPELPRALLVTEDDDPKNKIYLQKMWLGTFARPHMLNLDEQMITAPRLEQWIERGLPVGVWTVNEPGRAAELRELGVASIISDKLFVKN